MRVLVTGGSGFVGFPVINQLLAAGHTVANLGSKAMPLGSPCFEVIAGHLLDMPSWGDAVRKFAPEALVHLAWEGIPDFSPETSRRNLDQSARFLEWVVRNTAVQRLIVAGSCFEYGKVDGPCRETDLPEKLTYFTWAKTSLYQFARLFCGEHKLVLGWLRIYYVYGPRQRSGSLLPTILRSLQQNQQPEVRDPWNANDFVYVDDVADAFVRAAVGLQESGIYNVGYGSLTPVMDLLKYAEHRLCGHSRFSAAIAREHPPQPLRGFWSDNSKSERVLGWHPRTSSAEGVARMIQFLKQA